MKDKKIKKEFWMSLLISFIVGVVIFAIFFFVNGIGLIGAIDGAAYAGIFMLGIGGIIYVSRNGFFDIFAYGFKQLGSQIFSKKPSQYNDYPGYREEMKVKRTKQSKYYFGMIIVGAFYLLAAIILLLIKNSI